MDTIFALHEGEYGSPPDVIISAPGKVNIIGEHTEYSQGYVLPVAINRSIRVALSARSDNSIRFFSPDYSERKKTSLSNLKYKKEDRWANYPKGVMASLIRIGCAFKGVNITISGDIPVGIGLASSSAVTIATVVGLKKLFDLVLTDIQIIEAARFAEVEFIGIPAGISAPLVAYYAREGHALFLDSRSLEYEHIPLNIEGVELLITDSRLPGNIADSETDDYIQDMDSCLTGLVSKKPGHSLRDYEWQDLNQSIPGVEEGARRRCIHVVDENSRVLEARDALIQKDAALLGRLLNRTHESLRDLFEVSCPELDWLVKRALETPGVYGSRKAGEGFGGCTITLINANNIKEYEEHLEEYDRIFGFKAYSFICKPSSGVQILYPEES